MDKSKAYFYNYNNKNNRTNFFSFLLELIKLVMLVYINFNENYFIILVCFERSNMSFI